MFYTLKYNVVPDYLEKRTPHREDHFAFLTPYFDRGELIMGGAFDNISEGVQIIFRVEDKKLVEDFALNDPYVKSGVVTNWKVVQWNVAIGPQL